jgi:hypothetical protein
MKHSELMTEEGQMEYELVDYDKLLAHYMTSDHGGFVFLNQCCKNPGFYLIYFFCLSIYKSHITLDHSTSWSSWGNSESKIAKQSQQHNYLWLSSTDSRFYRLLYTAVSLCEW